MVCVVLTSTPRFVCHFQSLYICGNRLKGFTFPLPILIFLSYKLCIEICKFYSNGRFKIPNGSIAFKNGWKCDNSRVVVKDKKEALKTFSDQFYWKAVKQGDRKRPISKELLLGNKNEDLKTCAIQFFFLTIFVRYFAVGDSLQQQQPVWPDWAIYWTLGNFLKPLAIISLPKSPTFLGNFCKGVNIYNFSSEIIFG